MRGLPNIILWLLLSEMFTVRGTYAQIYEHYPEPEYFIGPSLGVMHYQGDLDNNRPWKFAKPGFGFVAGVYINPHLFFRFNFTQGWIAGSDKNASELNRRIRNLHFRSPVTEFSLQAGYDYFTDRHGWKYRPDVSPFVFGGIALFHFNPQAKPNPEWLRQYPGLFSNDQYVNLQPLGTEGQKSGTDTPPYRLWQIAIPMGGGLRVRIKKNIDLRLEFGLRKTFTDYLDDVSHKYANPESLPTLARLFSDRTISFGTENQLTTSAYERQLERGHQNQKDWYVYTAASLIFIIEGRQACPTFK